MLVILVMVMLASTDAFFLKRWGKGGLSALSKRGTGGREKVRRDVGCGMGGGGCDTYDTILTSPSYRLPGINSLSYEDVPSRA